MSRSIKILFSIIICILFDAIIGIYLNEHTDQSKYISDFIYYFFLLGIYGSWVYIAFVIAYHSLANWLLKKTMAVLAFILLGFILAILLGSLIHLWLGIFEKLLLQGILFSGLTGIVYGALYRTWIIRRNSTIIYP
jgi:uncharacterized protein YacL